MTKTEYRYIVQENERDEREEIKTMTTYTEKDGITTTTKQERKNMTRTELAEGIKAAMIDTGRAAEKWRVQVTGCERVGNNSDYVRVYVNVYKPRSRKPDVLWDICINAVKELIYWEHSTDYNAK